jgi:type VI secretion system protein ImpA
MSSAADTGTQVSPPPVVDLDAMLAPISEDAPAGESQQYTGLYDEIREARRADDLLAQGDWVHEPKAADWVKTASLAADALSTQTKDLQICAWMTEALVKLYGFTGLRDGLRVMLGLHEKFWADVYPEEDEGDLEARANAISLMDRQCAVAVKEVPLTKGQPYSYNDWEAASSFNVGPEVPAEEVEARRARAAEEGKITSDDWNKAKQASPRAFYETLGAVLDESWQAFQSLDRLTGDLYRNQAPGMGDLKASLDAVRTVVEKVLKEKRLLEPDPVGGAATGDGAGAVAPGGNGVAAPGAAAAVSVSGPIRSRQEALNSLAEVASFFRQTEPQSPVAYLIERAIKWSQMPLEAWLASIIKDTGVLGSIRETLGVEESSE